MKPDDEPPKYVGRGGWRGGGRPKATAEDFLHVVSIRLTQDQRDKLARLGGLQWLRDKLDKTKPEKAPAATEQARIMGPDAGKRLVTPIRLTDAQRSKLAELGGGAWLRDRIDKAREPK